MGAQISKNGAKDETAAEKPAEAANKSNGQVITLIIIFLQACDVLRGCAVTKNQVGSNEQWADQQRDSPVSTKYKQFHWISMLL